MKCNNKWPGAQRMLIFLTGLLCSGSCLCQEASKTIIASSGQALRSEAGSINYTLGEVLVTSKSSDVSKIMEGFHALISSNDVSTNIPEVTALTSFDVHPNPTTDFISLKLPFAAGGVQSISIIDGNGLSASYKYVKGDRVDLSYRPSGTYYILVVDEDDIGYLSKVVKM